MATSYNGWLAVKDGAGIDRAFSAAGASFPGGVKAGAVATIFRWLIERLNEIEPVVPGWCWGYEYRANVNNPSTLSCHSSGTAIDYNAPKHPNGARGTWTVNQVVAIRAILAQLGGVVRWGYDFTGTKDEMHFEIVGSESQCATVAARLGGVPGKPNVPTPGTPAQPEEDDMPYSEQQIKQLVHDALTWWAEEGPQSGIDPVMLRGAVRGAILNAANGDDPELLQAMKKIIRDGAMWARNDAPDAADQAGRSKS